MSRSKRKTPVIPRTTARSDPYPGTAAYWEKRYDEAAARIRNVEAALRDLVDYADITKNVDADAVTARVKRARVVLGLTSETDTNQLTYPYSQSDAAGVEP